jgi:hypothetical protein
MIVENRPNIKSAPETRHCRLAPACCAFSSRTRCSRALSFCTSCSHFALSSSCWVIRSSSNARVVSSSSSRSCTRCAKSGVSECAYSKRGFVAMSSVLGCSEEVLSFACAAAARSMSSMLLSCPTTSGAVPWLDSANDTEYFRGSAAVPARRCASMLLCWPLVGGRSDVDAMQRARTDQLILGLRRGGIARNAARDYRASSGPIAEAPRCAYGLRRQASAKIWTCGVYPDLFGGPGGHPDFF